MTKVLFVGGPEAVGEHLDALHVLLVHEDASVEVLGRAGVFDTESDRAASG